MKRNFFSDPPPSQKKEEKKGLPGKLLLFFSVDATGCITKQIVDDGFVAEKQIKLSGLPGQYS